MGNKGSKAKKGKQEAAAAAPAAAAGGGAPAGGANAQDIDGLEKITVDDFDLLKVGIPDWDHHRRTDTSIQYRF